MTFNWRETQQRFPRLFAAMVLGKRLRTKAGIAVAAVCIADGLIFWEPPFDLHELNGWIVAGLGLIVAGVAFRISALGCLKKKETLATEGVYSLCRHPLYLGSILMTYGFCCLLDDWVNYVAATMYFLIFYSLTIIWEEIRLAERFGEEYRQFAARTPLLLPMGRFRRNEFRWSLAMRNGGALLIAVTLLLLAADEVMAKMMHR